MRLFLPHFAPATGAGGDIPIGSNSAQTKEKQRELQKKLVPGSNIRAMPVRPLADQPAVTRGSLLSEILGAPELETLDASDYAERPEFDAKRAKHLQYANAAALLLAGLASTFDKPIAAATASGLAGGYGTALQNLQTGYDDRLKAFYDNALDVGKFNTGVTNDQLKLGYEAQKDAAKEKGAFMRQDATMAAGREKLEEDRRHNKELEQIRKDENKTAAEKNEAAAREDERHNRAMEKIGNKNADANQTRAGALESITGRPAAAQQLDIEIARIDGQIAELSATQQSQLLNRDRIKTLENSRADLVERKAAIVSEAEGPDVEAITGGEDTGSGTGEPGASRFGLDELFK